MNMRRNRLNQKHGAAANRPSAWHCIALRLQLAIFLVAGCSTFGQQLVQNGGFESGNFGGWTKSGNTSSTFVSTDTNYVHSGTYGADLGPDGPSGFLSQTIATVPGQSYQLSLWLYCNDLGFHVFQVSWDGTDIFDQTNFFPNGWTNLHFSVNATSTSTLLQFQFVDDTTFLGLDDVSVTGNFTLAQGTTWFATNSLYLVISNMVVTNLTIEPGVTVLFNGPYSLKVTGLVQAVGTSNNPIVFAPVTNSGGWQGIYFSSANTNSAMAYCQITGATNGALRFTNTPFVLNNCTISSNSGPLGGGIYSDSALALTNCYILNNAAITADTNSPYSARGGGIYVTNGPLTLQSCVISNNTAIGPDLAYGGGVDCESGNVLINGCTIISNFVSGEGVNWNNLTNWPQTSASSQEYTSIASSADGITLLATAYFGTYNGNIFKSTNAGISWTQITGAGQAPGINQSHWQKIACSANASTQVAISSAVDGDPPHIAVTTNAGNSWTQIVTPATNWASVAVSANGSKLLVAASPGGIFTTTNSGVSWIPTGAPNKGWTSIASSADGTKLAATADGVYISTNSGVTWTATSAPTNYWGAIASSADGSELVGEFSSGNSSIYISKDSGNTWVQTSAPALATSSWSSIACSADGTKIVATILGNAGAVYVSIDAGITWINALTVVPTASHDTVACSADGTRMVGANYSIYNGGGIYAAQALILAANSAIGGGMYLNSSAILSAKNSRFTDNKIAASVNKTASYGGAIALGQGNLLNCTFTSNRATNGGALYLNGVGPLSITNCLFGGNTAVGGGAFYSTNNNAGEFIENCTVVSNSPDGFNGYIGTIHDSILFFNGTNQIVNGNPTVTYSDIQGGYTGAGNLNLNPQFADSTNYLLSALSPMIDAGDPNLIFNDAAFPPSQGGDRNDMGAYGGPMASLWPAFISSIPTVLVNGQPASPLQVFNIPSTTPPTISFSNGFPGGSFEYTLDGSNPLVNSTFTTAPFILSQPAVVRVIAYSSDFSSYKIAAPVTVNVLPYSTLNAGTAGGGTVYPTNVSVLSNTVVMLTASNLPNWTFINWSGDASGTNNPLSLTLNGSKNVQAVFGTPLSTSVIGGSGNGSIQINPILSLYPYSSTVRLSAVPATTNLYFQTWGGAATGSNSPLDFIVTNTLPNITAKFTSLPANNYSLTLLAAGPGSVGKTPPASFYTNGTIVTVTATPNSGYLFAGWSGDAAGTNNPLNVTMNFSKFITANFGTNPPPANIPPSVTITNPLDGATFNVPASITLGAGVNDSDGFVTQVVFLSGTNQIGIRTNTPFTFLWTNAPVGTNVLTAVATDDGALSTTSAPVSVVVKLPPPVAAVFTLSTNAYSISANGGSLGVTILKNFNSSNAIVNYLTVDGSAIPYQNGQGNYLPASGSLSFTNGELSKTLQIQVFPTAYYVGDRTFHFELFSSGDGSSLGSPNSAVVTILDTNSPASSNSVTQNPFPSQLPPHSGRLSITLMPMNCNGQWRLLRETAWRNSGDVVSNLAAGNYEVEFKPAAGFVHPDNTSNAVFDAALTVVTGWYGVSLQPTALGSLQILLQPPQAIAAGAQWRILGETNWHDSGFTLTNLIAGDQVVEFKTIAGWVTPALQLAIVSADQNNQPLPVAYTVATGTAATPPTVVPFASATTPGGSTTPPYLWNGQLLTDTGYGSGCVVKPRVVLTAAHVVFNDSTLSYVTGAKWFFQRYAGQYEPPTQTPRGWYTFSGYSSARSNDSVGFESPVSQNLDAAALYFFEDAGRGGYCGYLVSDTNVTWLKVSGQNEGQKTLIGYPVEGIDETNRGQMFSTDYRFSQGFQFQLLSNHVFVTTNLFGYPGMSGGAVCVQYSDGRFFPAAIYLGQSAGQAIVREIDGGVADLINKANATANTGNDFVGGGVVMLSSGAATNFGVGYFQIVLTPPGAVAAGGAWTILELTNNPRPTFNDNSAVYAILAPATTTYTLSFQPVPKYLAPSNRTVQIIRNQTAFITNKYVSLEPQASALAMSNGVASLAFTNAPASQRYAIERSTNLVNWIALTTNQVPLDGTLRFTNSGLENLPGMFYRVRWVP
jgi:hypothetical protein